MIKRQSLLLVLLITFSSLQHAMADTECVFERNSFKASRYENKKLVKKLVWDQKQTKASIITTMGDLVSVTHWSCNHLGLNALMLVNPYNFEQVNGLEEYFKQLAILVLDESEKNLVFKLLGKKNITIDSEEKIMTINDDLSAEFYLKYSVLGESVLLEIKYYQN